MYTFSDFFFGVILIHTVPLLFRAAFSSWATGINWNTTSDKCSAQNGRQKMTKSSRFCRWRFARMLLGHGAPGDSVMIGYPRMVRWFTSKDVATFTPLWHTRLYQWYYYMSSGALRKTVFVKHSLFVNDGTLYSVFTYILPGGISLRNYTKS